MKRYLLAALLFQTGLIFADEQDSADEAQEIDQESVIQDDVVAFENLETLTSPTFESFSPENLAPPSIEAPKAPDLGHKNSFIAVSLAYVFPGLGHVYLNDWKTAASLASSAAIPGSMMNINLSNESLTTQLRNVYQNTSFYGIYSTYRDVRNRNNQFGYKYPMPQDDFKDLALAPFRPSILAKPSVWGGFLGFFTAAAAVGYYSLHNSKDLAASSIEEFSPMMAFPVGLGEEAFFRGYLQPVLSEPLTPWGGILVSSAIFAAAHLSNANDFTPEKKRRYYQYSIPLIGSFSVYFGWLANYHQSLQEGVALHAWYDFTLLALSASVRNQAKNQGARILPPQKFTLSIPF